MSGCSWQCPTSWKPIKTIDIWTGRFLSLVETTRIGISQIRLIHKKIILHIETLLAHLELLWLPWQFVVCFIIHSFIFMQAQSFSCYFLTTSMCIPSLSQVLLPIWYLLCNISFQQLYFWLRLLHSSVS